MKEKATIAGGAGALGFIAGNITPHDALEMTKWLQQSLGPVGFISFAFNIAQAGALYLTVVFFSKRTDQMRQDIKEAFTGMANLVEKIHATMDKYAEAVTGLKIALTKSGVDC